jgi:hypothetical protein
MTAVTGQAVRQDQQAGRDLVLDEVDRLAGLVRRLEDEVALLTLEREEDEVVHAAPSPCVEAEDMTRLLAEQHELRQGLVGCEGRLDEQGRLLGHVKQDVQAQINALTDRVTALAEGVSWLRGKEEERQNGWLRRLFRGWWR